MQVTSVWLLQSFHLKKWINKECKHCLWLSQSMWRITMRRCSHKSNNSLSLFQSQQSSSSNSAEPGHIKLPAILSTEPRSLQLNPIDLFERLKGKSALICEAFWNSSKRSRSRQIDHTSEPAKHLASKVKLKWIIWTIQLKHLLYKRTHRCLVHITQPYQEICN